MTRTVYLDTAFYVALARAADDLAATTLDALDDLDVRIVISFSLLRELLSSADRPERDRTLHARITSLRAPPYATVANLTWDYLLLGGGPRRDFADKLRGIDDALVRAESAGVLANTTYPHGLRQPATTHTAATLPFMRPDGTADIGKLGEWMRVTLGPLGIEVRTPLTEETLPELQAALAAFLPSGAREAIERKNRITASAVATDNRPYEVILERASDRSAARLAHTYRDAGHMAEFVEHAEAIDLFQMDGPQHTLLERDAEHELLRLGLHERCFSAPDLPSVIAVLRHRLGATVP
ncbi:MAG: hypothetical protein ACK6CU_01785 [Deltaproteobacteria bacterium]|jgi:hypothetical protein